VLMSCVLWSKVNFNLVSTLTEVSAQSRPHYLTELVGRGISYLAPATPLAKSLRGKVSDDPKVEADFFADRE
jgi:acylglycerol lipase